MATTLLSTKRDGENRIYRFQRDDMSLTADVFVMDDGEWGTYVEWENPFDGGWLTLGSFETREDAVEAVFTEVNYGG